MIVEFMGCTGAGKTTLARGTVGRLEATGYAVRDVSVAGNSVRLTLANALSTPFHLLALMRDWDLYGSHLRITRQALAATAPDAFWAATRTAAAIRLLGRRARHARSHGPGVAVVDDGALLTVQLAFYADRPPPPPLLERFIALAPLPDIVVWVDAPLDALVGRALSRPDPPRELRGCSADEIRTRLARVEEAYRGVAQAARAEGRVIRAWNPTAPPRERDHLAARVANDIRQRLDACPA